VVYCHLKFRHIFGETKENPKPQIAQPASGSRIKFHVSTVKFHEYNVVWDQSFIYLEHNSMDN
jgi:hypothetical protein